MVIWKRHPTLKRNLFTWKDHDVSTIIVVLLAALLVLTLIVPTSVIFAFIIAFTFYIGTLLGIPL
ncbi:hypothetical protein AK812_SmicGene45068, partial [Symbiodinium microadriaticum]